MEEGPPSSVEFIALLDQMDEPVQVAFLEAMKWLAQLPSDQPKPSMSEMDAIIQSIIAKNIAKENGNIN